MSHTTPAVPQESDRKRWLALIVLCTGFLMIILDQTIVNVALPSIKRDLGFSTSGLAWVINAYLIAFGGLLLLVGRLGDLIGRRRIFLTGLTVFTLASLLGFATFVLSFVPLGPMLLWAPAAGWLYYQGATGWAIFLVIWSVISNTVVEQVLKDSQIDKSKVDEIVLVGGSTRIPRIQKLLTDWSF